MLEDVVRCLIGQSHLLLWRQHPSIHFARQASHHLSQDRLQVSHCLFEDVDALEEPGVDPVLDSICGHETVDRDAGILWAISIKSTDPLLDLHRVPWKIVVHQNVAELEIETLRTHLRRQEYLGTIPCSERVDDPLVLTHRDTAVDGICRNAIAGETPLQIGQGVSEEGEYQDAC